MYANRFGSTRDFAASYRNVGVDTSVAGADPHRLITLLFDGALERIARARAALARNDVAGRGAAIGSAIRIVQEGLRAALRPGGELAANLDALYEYVGRRLLEANARASDAMLAEAAALLDTVRDGWVRIGSGAQGGSVGTLAAPGGAPSGSTQTMAAPAAVAVAARSPRTTTVAA